MSLRGQKRIFYILMVFTIVIILFAARVAWIQWSSAHIPVTSGGKTINELAVRQREEGIELDSGRGHFVDRKGQLLTGFIRWIPTLFPVSELPDQNELRKLAELLGTSPANLISKWNSLKSPYAWSSSRESTNTLAGMEASEETVSDPLYGSAEAGREWPAVQGVEWLPYMERYPSGGSGSQWLGYIAQRPEIVQRISAGSKAHPLPLTLQVGASGLERTMDRFMRGTGGTRVYYTVDGRKRPLTEIGTRVVGTASLYYPVQVQTTIDKGIQQKIEVLMEKMDIREGAAVVLEVSKGDVVGMVSRPFYNPRQVDPSSDEWSNRAVKATVPGSIFKTVIAAAALEERVTSPGEVFYCTGHYGKYGMSCWKKEGHGKITLEEGYAHSCNVVFATLGERLSAESIANTALKLGLSHKVGWHEEATLGGEPLWQIDQEEAGRVFSSGVKVDGGVLAQTALGQRDVLMTPLQAANMVLTLLHDGRVTSPRMVSRIRYKDGSTLVNFPVQMSDPGSGQISPRTARLLLGWMREVVKDGTGRALLQAAWPVAGKSGTAQAQKGTRDVNHQWFIGYGPVDAPKYAVAVLVQNRPEGSEHQAVALFRSIMDMLAQEK